MIVKRENGSWVLIRQLDHADHAGRISDAWKVGPFGGQDISDSLRVATARHDLGWVEADSEPKIDPDGGWPSNFTRIDEATHTAFYARAVRTVAETDPSAAYLVSLHATGLYSKRYGWTGLNPVDWTAIGDHGRALLDSERAFRIQLAERIAPEQREFEALWRSYMLLETFDCLSLLTCLSFDSEGLGPVPSLPRQWEMLSVSRVGPWEIALHPFPFPGSELVVTVPCRRVENERFASSEEFREVLATVPETLQETVYRAF
jgi:hypothetical protein